MMEDGHLLDRGKINQVLCLSKIENVLWLEAFLFDFIALLDFFARSPALHSWMMDYYWIVECYVCRKSDSCIQAGGRLR